MAGIMRRWKVFVLSRLHYHGKTDREIFDDIYAKGGWGRRYGSGVGSLAENSSVYEQFVSDFVNKRHDIRTIVDIGCGEFQVARRMLARVAAPVRYIGCDVSPTVIEANREHASESVRFLCMDAVVEDLPPGDLVLVKEVIQHLSNESAGRLLEKLGSFRYALVTNGVPRKPKAWNVDMPTGPWTRRAWGSGIWPEHPPFSIPAEEVLVTPHRANADMLFRTVLLRDPLRGPAGAASD